MQRQDPELVGLRVLRTGTAAEPGRVDVVHPHRQRSQLSLDVLEFGNRRAREELVDAAVVGSHQQHGGSDVRSGTVAGTAGHPSRLLDVLLDGGGHLQMHDQGDVRFVDTQTEGLGGHHHIDLAVAERILGVLALGVAHSAVVGPHPVAEGAQQAGEAGRVPAGRHVDDGAPPAEGLHHLG